MFFVKWRRRKPSTLRWCLQDILRSQDEGSLERLEDEVGLLRQLVVNLIENLGDSVDVEQITDGKVLRWIESPPSAS